MRNPSDTTSFNTTGGVCVQRATTSFSSPFDLHFPVRRSKQPRSTAADSDTRGRLHCAVLVESVLHDVTRAYNAWAYKHDR